MSTAVYLATNLYLHRLAVIERVVPVTARNVHRLVLAGLRVAMKVFEDLSWPHRRFAKVGGVGERELGRLEVGFCFLMGWRLGVGGGFGGWVGVLRGRRGAEEGGKGCEREGVVDGRKAEVEVRCDLPGRSVEVSVSLSS